MVCQISLFFMWLFLIQKLTESIFENHRILTCSILGWMFCLRRSEAWAAKIEGSFGQEEKNGKEELPKMLEMIFQYLPSSSTIHIHQKQFQTKVKCSKSWITIQKCHDFFDPTANSSMSQFDQNLRLVMIRLKIFSLQICTIWKPLPQRFSRFSVAALLLSRVMFSPLLFVISMDSGDVRIEDLDATSTTLIMRGLNRQTTREMLQTLLCLDF